MKTLILGGVRSGKSRLAEQLATQTALPVTYIATATGDDEEMQKRIATHRQHRPTGWALIEEPMQLGRAVADTSTTANCLIVDCLTLWLTNLILAEDQGLLKKQTDSLLSALPNVAGEIIFVANETNMGVIPMGELSRRYCDEAGVLHQRIAQQCDRVILTVAGLPHVLKGEPF